MVLWYSLITAKKIQTIWKNMPMRRHIPEKQRGRIAKYKMR